MVGAPAGTCGAIKGCEDGDTNALKLSLKVFKDVVAQPALKDAIFIVLLNKASSYSACSLRGLSVVLVSSLYMYSKRLLNH